MARAIDRQQTLQWEDYDANNLPAAASAASPAHANFLTATLLYT